MYNKAIYYPYIDLPKGPWLTRMLLYWDQIGTIAPFDPRNERSFDKYSSDLIESELLLKISPDAYTCKIPRFKEAFLDLIDKDPYLKKNVSLGSYNTTRIHIGKMGDGLDGELADRGLASEAKYPWYRVESHTANLFMAYLASTLGILDDLKMEPLTDSKRWFSIYSENDLPKQDVNLNGYREGIFKSIFPVPSGLIPIKELLEFKRKYGEQLIKFRMEVEFAVTDIVSAQTPQLAKRKESYYIQKFESQVIEIKAHMEERFWPPLVMTSLLAYVPMINAIYIQDPKQMLLSISPLVAAIYGAYIISNDKRKQILSAPAAYAAIVQKSFHTPKGK
jgi:hypothetical protein